MTNMNIKKLLFSAAVACSLVLAQGPPAGAPKGGGAPKGPPRPAFWVSSTAWADGDFVPMKHSGRGDNKSPAFEFHWNLGTTPTTAPDTLQSYAVIFHDAENSTNRTAVDTLHWSAFNIPGSEKGLPEGLPAGDQANGMRIGPGIRGGAQGAYFGPGAGPGPIHHYIFEFYALDAKLELGPTPTRDELLKAMDTHVIGKAVYYGRFPQP